MSPFLQLILVLAAIILMAKLAGHVSTRLGQPSVLGELLIGLVLGPSLLDLTHLAFITDTHLPEVVAELAELGVLLLMFLAGLELEFSELAGSMKVSVFAGGLGVIVPVLLGALVGVATGMDFSHAVFLGLTLGATSVSISAQVLMELKVLRSRVGLGLLGAAVFDDILVILLLSIFTALAGGNSGVGQIFWTIARMLFYLGGSALLGWWVLPALSRLFTRLTVSQGPVALAIVVMLVYGISAEVLGGMAAITGAFVAGLMYGRTSEKKIIEHGFATLAYAFFVPIFFVNIGLHVNLRELRADSLWLLAAISLVAIAGKVLGAGGGARLSGFTWRESLQVGTGMISRGEVGLIVASVGIAQGLLNSETFTLIVGVVLVTTLVTPPLLRALFPRKPIG